MRVKARLSSALAMIVCVAYFEVKNEYFMEHLALEIFDRTGTGSQYAVLDPDTTITIVDTSEIFASGDVFSWDFKLNIPANLHIFGTSGDLHGSRLHEQVNKRRARLWVESLPLYLGYLKLDNEVDVDADGNVNVKFESGQKTFDELIEGAKANQVPMMDDVSIGMAFWKKRVASCSLTLQASAKFKDEENTEYENVFYGEEPHEGSRGTEIVFSCDGEVDGSSTQQYPQMVFPKGDFEVVSGSTSSGSVTAGRRASAEAGSSIHVDCINTDSPYDDQHPYCNIALCYQKQGYDRKQKDGSYLPDYSSEPEAQRGYEYMPANRVNSAPNFFVIYWIKALMKHLGIHIEENQMMDVEDLRRLFFVNTKCAYEEPMQLRTVETSTRYGKYKFESEGRSIKRLIPEYFGKEDGEESHGTYVYKYEREELINSEESELNCKEYTVGQIRYDTQHVNPSEIPEIDKINVKIKTIEEWRTANRENYEKDNGYLHEAFASKECFPNVDISEVIKAIENGFGVRFLFSDNYQRVRIVLLKNIFNDTEIQNITCEMTGKDVKVENNIRGFRMTYGNTDDTQFYYKGFADQMAHIKTLWPDESDKHDYSHWKLDANYASMINKVSAFDKTCYVTPNTGNAYIVKVDKDAKRYNELHPSFLGCADFMDAEDGDCTGDAETIHEINVGFMPAIMNDVNWEKERSGDADGPLYALFVDEKMRPRRPELEEGVDYSDPEVDYKIYSDPTAADGSDKGLYGKDSKAKEMKDGGIVKPGEFTVASDMYVTQDRLRADVHYSIFKYQVDLHGESEIVEYKITWPLTFSIEGYINEGYRLYLQDNFEPNDDGIAPVETHDWGLTLGIMRGSGSDAHVNYAADPDDHEGNQTWNIVAGSSVTAHPDTCDSYGNLWDYNGESSGIGSDGRLSLKLRAEKPNPYYDQTRPEFETISTKAAAAEAMTTIFTTSNCDLLNRPKVPNATMRAAGWDCPGDGYATVCSVGLAVRDDHGNLHELLWTPILSNGNVMSADELRTYVGTYDGYSMSSLKTEEARYNDLLLDIDTTGKRAEMLHELQAIYYAEDGEYVAPVAISTNPRYLEITNPDLQQRGLSDQLYKAFSIFIRNAKVIKRPVRMELAQLLAIDKTKRVRVGDIMGFIRKMQYTVSNETGLGEVTMEIMYI